MPLVVKDFKKKVVKYEYKDRTIRIAKKGDFWRLNIYKKDKKGASWLETDSSVHFTQKNALIEARDFIKNKEYKPKFKRGDIIQYGKTWFVVFGSYNYCYELKNFQGFMSPQERGLNEIDKTAKKVGEITDMSVLEGE